MVMLVWILYLLALMEVQFVSFQAIKYTYLITTITLFLLSVRI